MGRMEMLISRRIPISLGLLVVYILAAPFVPGLIPFLPWATAGIVALVGVYAVWASELFDLWLAMLIAVVFVIAHLAFPHIDPLTITLRTAALTALVLLHVVLLIGPWSRFVPKIRTWYKHRRHLGVVTFLLALLHAGLLFNLLFGRSITAMWSMVFLFFGSVALLVMLVLAVTSWDWFQKHVSLRMWSAVHGGVFLIFLAETAYVLRLWQQTQVERPLWATLSLIGFVVFWIVIAPWGFAPSIVKALNGWKQLHVLVYVAYASVVLHFYYGASVIFGPWMKPAILVLCAVVVASHAAGWIRVAQEKKRYAVPESSQEPWHEACAMSELIEGKGKRVDIHGSPVAIFLHKGNVIACNGFCAHQKGPLWEGKIVSGYITCPWHGWQYSVRDGKAPAGLHDSTPMYETRVENGKVFIKVEKK